MQALAVTKKDMLIKEILPAAFFALAMVAASMVRVPLFFTPVPVTLQTLVLFISIIVLRRKAVFAALGFVAFNFAYLAGPTGGYLAGFVVCALMLGRLNLSSMAILPRFFLLICGNMIFVYGLGMLWLVLGFKMSFVGALYAGFLPFIAVDLLKAAMAAAIVKH